MKTLLVVFCLISAAVHAENSPIQLERGDVKAAIHASDAEIEQLTKALNLNVSTRETKQILVVAESED